MPSRYLETLSAFFDGEPVDADELAGALREPDALEFLVESARLRRTVQADTSRPPEEFCDAMRERLARADSRAALRRRVVEVSLAASLVFAAALGGFGVRALLERKPSVETHHIPPVVPTPSPPPASPAPVTAAPVRQQPAASSLPRPTQHIRFQKWEDRGL